MLIKELHTTRVSFIQFPSTWKSVMLNLTSQSTHIPINDRYHLLSESVSVLSKITTVYHLWHNTGKMQHMNQLGFKENTRKWKVRGLLRVPVAGKVSPPYKSQRVVTPLVVKPKQFGLSHFVTFTPCDFLALHWTKF